MSLLTRLNGGTINLISVAAVAGTTSTFTSTVTSKGMINGKFATELTAQTNAATPTTDHATGNAFIALTENKACSIVFGINDAGTLKMCQGPIVDTYVGVTTTVGAFKNAPQFPEMPDDFLPFAYTLVRTAPDAADWTPGTSSWTASGVSATTFKNIGLLPNRPQIA